MATLKHMYSALFSLTILVSCGGNETESNKPNKQETPKALQDDKIEIYSKERDSDDLTNELYLELVDKTPALKKLEDDLDAFHRQPMNPVGKFLKYDGKSKSYYQNANYYAEAISDSLLKKRIMALILKSDNAYKDKSADINSLIKQISKNDVSLQDHRSILKVVLTLPIIEKYQADLKPDRKEFMDVLKQQEKLIKRTDSLTPAY